MPLVACLTNTVAAHFTANCLLAVGAKPAMVEVPDEAAELAGVADAVLVNVGTVHPRQADAMRAAIGACRAHRVPWVLDPVAVQTLAYRRALVREFLAMGPTLVRGNLAEIDFLKKAVPGFPNGVPVLATGETDEITTATGVERVTGGVPMLQAITATGCAQGALLAAHLGRGIEPIEACRQVSRLMKRAGETAWEHARSPGAFMIALQDALWGLTHA